MPLFPITHRLHRVFADAKDDKWDPQSRGGFQAVSLAVTLAMALLGGLVTGGCKVGKCSECMLQLGQSFDLIYFKFTAVIILCHSN